jgi:hypothetical protein
MRELLQNPFPCLSPRRVDAAPEATADGCMDVGTERQRVVLRDYEQA